MSILYPDVRMTPDLKEVLRDERVDAVIVVTPVNTHFDIVSHALHHGKHVLCEKPLTLSSIESEMLLVKGRQCGLTVMVGHTFIFNEAVIYLKDLMVKGSLGDIVYLSMLRTGLGPVRTDVNVVFDLAAHDISMLLYWLDVMPVSAAARGICHSGGAKEDVAFAMLDFPTGIRANIQVSWLDPIKQRLVKIVGTQGMAVFDDTSVTEKIRVYAKGSSYRNSSGDFGGFQLSAKDGDTHIPNIPYGEPLQREFNHFLTCVRSGQRPQTDVEDGLRVIKVLEAINASMRNNGQSHKVHGH